jgi:arylsulfatase A-like enzyme
MPYYLVHGPLETRQDYIDYFEKKLRDHTFAGKKVTDVPTIAAMTRHLDDCVGRLMAALERLGIAEETIVVFTSDNGSYNENFTGGLRGTKGTVYEGGMKVPYIFKWSPKIEAGSTGDARITFIDLYPTLLDLAGVDRPDDYTLDGISLRDYLLGKEASLPDRPIVCYYPKYAQFDKRKETWRVPWRNVIYSGDYKLRENVEYGLYELYNLEDDPTESRDLAKSHPEIAERLREELQAWKESMGVGELVPNPDYMLR